MNDKKKQSDNGGSIVTFFFHPLFKLYSEWKKESDNASHEQRMEDRTNDNAFAKLEI